MSPCQRDGSEPIFALSGGVKISNSLIAILCRDYNCDSTTTYRARLLLIRRKQKMNMSIFRRSRVVVVSQSNRNCDIGFTLNSVLRQYVELGCLWFSKSNCVEINKDRLILSATQMFTSESSFWRYNRFVRIFDGV